MRESSSAQGGGALAIACTMARTKVPRDEINRAAMRVSWFGRPLGAGERIARLRKGTLTVTTSYAACIRFGAARLPNGCRRWQPFSPIDDRVLKRKLIFYESF